jgi:hypothetical protein
VIMLFIAVQAGMFGMAGTALDIRATGPTGNTTTTGNIGVNGRTGTTGDTSSIGSIRNTGTIGIPGGRMAITDTPAPSKSMNGTATTTNRRGSGRYIDRNRTCTRGAGMISVCTGSGASSAADSDPMEAPSTPDTAVSRKGMSFPASARGP